jgi:hypothetical protein
MARTPLERPPSDRYRPGRGGDAGRRPDVPDPVVAAGGRRAAVGALLAAAVGAALLVVVGGLLEVTTGIIFVAGITGAAVGLLLAGSPRPRRTIRWASVGITLVVVAVGAIGTWLIALGQGGTLGLVDFLWATTGLLVPAEAVVAAAAAAWGAGAGPIRP